MSVDLENREACVRQILAEHAGLKVDIGALDPKDDLYVAGMSSRASVSVMLAIEAMFNVEFPDAMLRREVFGSINAMCEAIQVIALA